MKQILLHVQNYLKTKAVGFYLLAVVALLSLIATIAYLVGYVGSKYMSVVVLIMLICAFVVTGVLMAFKKTSAFAPISAGVFNLAGFCMFIRTVYMYFTEVFYGGISAEAIQSLNPCLIICMLFMLINVILSVVCVFVRQNKKTVINTAEEVIDEK